MSTILIVLLVVALVVGIAPVWPHSKSWGPGPVAVIVTILVILALLRYLRVV